MYVNVISEDCHNYLYVGLGLSYVTFFFRLLRGGEASGGGLSQSTSVGMASLVSATFPLCYSKHTQHNVSVNLLIFIIFNLNSHFFQYAQLTFLRKHSSKCSSQTT